MADFGGNTDFDLDKLLSFTDAHNQFEGDLDFPYVPQLLDSPEKARIASTRMII
jgi:hypothetical protein